MILKINRLTNDQQAKLKRAVGKGLWDHIMSGIDIPVTIIEIIKERLRKEGYAIEDSNPEIFLNRCFFNMPDKNEN